MNTRLLFSCVNGNALIGAQEVTCLPSGNWSSPFPVCESKFKITLDQFELVVKLVPLPLFKKKVCQRGSISKWLYLLFFL